MFVCLKQTPLNNIPLKHNVSYDRKIGFLLKCKNLALLAHVRPY